jgi:modulator of FtsH protease
VNAWTGFFQASASASATLAGLLVVAISINLSRILDFPQLPDRAAAALVPAAGVLVVSLLALVPGQPVRMFGAEVFAAGALIWILSAILLSKSWRRSPEPRRARWWTHVLSNMAQGLPLVAAGALVLLGVANGLYWMVPGIIATLLVGIMNAWVLLIEILR